jgi:hypothetical protein
MTLKRSLGVCGILTLVGIIGCSKNNTYVKKGEIDKTINQQAENSRYIEALGIGAADVTLTNTTQRRATSRDAAIVQAQYEMLSYVKGVQLEGGITVEKAMETDSNLETYLKQVIKGAEVVKNEWTNDDGCVVTLRLDKKKLEDGGLKLKS